VVEVLSKDLPVYYKSITIGRAIRAVQNITQTPRRRRRE
jgi:hypothetical protein